MLCLAVFALAEAGAAVDYPLRWRWSNPAPHGNNIFDLAYSPLLNLAVQVTERGQLYSSSDLRLWTPRESGTEAALRGVAFFGGPLPRMVITGEAGTVLYADELDAFQAGTLQDGPTGDWLEAVTASAGLNLLVAVGDNGAVYTSGNGADWKRQTPEPPMTTWLRGVAFGSGVFVAVGEGGFVARSANGTNWSQVISGTLADLNRVNFAAGRFTASGAGGVSLTSTNAGLQWMPDQSGATGALYYAAGGSAAGAARLLVGQNEVRLQEAGVWTDELGKGAGPPPWTYFTALARNNYFLAAGRTGLMAEGFKTNANPYFWFPADPSIRHWLFDVFYATNVYVAAGDRATIMTSVNGVDWSLELVPDAVTNSILLGVGGTTNLLVAAGSGGSLIVSPNLVTNLPTVVTNEQGETTLTNIPVSSLGVIWHEIEPRPTTMDLQGVCFGAGLYVVTGGGGTILTSPDGTNWTLRSTPTNKLLTGAAAWDGGLVVTGDDGVIMASSDGIQWALRPSGTAHWIYKARYLNGVLVAVGQSGTLLTSVNGMDWTPRDTGTAAWLNDATFVDDTYFVVGTQGTVLTSTNLSDWTERGTITLKSLYGAATDGAQLVACGIEGVLLRAQVVPNLEPVEVLSYGRVETNDVIQNLYLFGGHVDQRFTLDRRTNLTEGVWETGPQLEFFNGEGTLFYIETIAPGKAPPNEYYGGRLAP